MTAENKNIRPKLMRDSTFLPTGHGVLFSNRLSTFSLKGKNMYKLVSLLAPKLDGKATLETICAELPAGMREVVERLVHSLSEKGVILDQEPGTGDYRERSKTVKHEFRVRLCQRIGLDNFSDRCGAKFYQRDHGIGGGPAWLACAR